ncbi:MAG: hypothetical protein D6785_12105 [Planctomycetota bacterium]|nr:MAG: hypothetical protein D6785_12105 [Planctomycetota bacterium]
MNIKFIWKETGEEVFAEQLDELARKMEILVKVDWLYTDGLGNIVLLDNCGQAYPVTEYFDVVIEEEK